MLHKRSRLRAKEVEDVLKKGRSAHSIHLQLKFLPGVLSLRTAAVVPKSLAKKATLRNRLRRALYRALHEQNMAQYKGISIVFVRRIPQGSLTPTFSNELSALLKNCK